MSIPKSGVVAPSKAQVGTLYSLGLLEVMGSDYLIGQQTTKKPQCYGLIITGHNCKHGAWNCGINHKGFRGACRSDAFL
jgi:hypothetical protein